MTKPRVQDDRFLSWIAEFNNSHDRSPTVREIGEGLGYTSPSTVHRRLKRFLREGRLQEVPKGGLIRELHVDGRAVGREAHLEKLLQEALDWFESNYPTRDIPRWVLKSRGVLGSKARHG